MIDTIAPATNKVKSALWFAYAHPEWGKHQATLARHQDTINHDPLLQRAYNVIMQGPQAIQNAINSTDTELIEVLIDIANRRPPAGLIRKYEQAYAQYTAINDDFFAKVDGPKPVMIKTEDYFNDGKGYPKTPKHTCKSCYWFEGNDKGVGYKRSTEKLWRTRTVKHAKNGSNGWILEQCPACYHERVMRFCKQVIAEVSFFNPSTQPNEVVYGYSIVTPNQFNQITRKLKRNQIRFVSFPMKQNSLIIHNNGDDMTVGRGKGIQVIQWHKLPRYRHELYELIADYACTPEGKNIGGTRDWGIEYKGTQGNRKVEKEEEEDRTPPKQDGSYKPFKIQVKDWGRLLIALEAHTGQEIATNKGKIDIDMRVLVDIADKQNIKYAFVGNTAEQKRINDLMNDWYKLIHREDKEPVCISLYQTTTNGGHTTPTKGAKFTKGGGQCLI